jgi:uncharacterized protein
MKCICIILLLSFLLSGCSSKSKSPEEARKELGQMNIQYNEGAFINSAKDGDIVALKLFLAAGMDANARDSLGRLAYQFASQPVNAQIEFKEAVNLAGIPDQSRGATALMAATVMGRPEIVKALLSKGVDLNAEDRVDMTALSYAVWKQDAELASALLRAGAKPNGGKEPNAIMLAVMAGNEDIVKAMIEAGGDVNARYSNGYDLLMLATYNHLTNTLKLLIDKGADVNGSSAEGKTALKIATEKGLADIADILKQHGAKESAR